MFAYLQVIRILIKIQKKTQKTIYIHSDADQLFPGFVITRVHTHLDVLLSGLGRVILTPGDAACQTKGPSVPNIVIIVPISDRINPSCTLCPGQLVSMA